MELEKNKLMAMVVVIVLVTSSLMALLILLPGEKESDDRDEDKDNDKPPFPPSEIALEPSGVEMEAGDNMTFSAKGYDANGTEVPISPVWSVDGGGDINSSGVFTARRVGVWTVYANASNISGEAEVTVIPGPLDSLSIVPEEVSVRAGDVIDFSVNATDAFDNTMDIGPEWTSDGGGEIDANGTFRARTVGSWTITACSSGVEAEAMVSINPGPLDRILLDPPTATVAAGDVLDINVSGFDAWGNDRDVTPTWSTTGGGQLAPDGDGSFHARIVGVWTVFANQSGVSGNATVTVIHGPLDSIFITPTSVDLVAGENETFTAKGGDAYGNIITLTPTWSVDGGGDLEVEGANATFEARIAGNWNLTANASGIGDAVEITVGEAALSMIEVTPDNQTIVMGDTLSFAANGSDAYGNPVDIDPEWLEPGDGGDISGSGTFTAVRAGNWTILAQEGDVQGTAIVNVRPIPRGDRIFSIDINEAGNNDYDHAMDVASSTGSRTATLSLPWEAIEPVNDTYDFSLLDISNSYYPAWNYNLTLMIGPLDTNNKRLPADLANETLDDPVVIQRFKDLLTMVFDHIPDLELTAFAIGNEVDIYMGTDTAKYNEYKTFLDAAMDHVRTIRPDLPLGVKTTFEGVTDYAKNDIINLNANTDVIMVNYYPMEHGMVKDPSVVAGDFDNLTSIYPYKEIYLTECGYPSSPVVGSSQELQARFIREVWYAWDNHTDQIKLINFVWLHDISQQKLDEFEQYYGSSDPKFLAFLGSLGLREHDGTGTDKLAFVALKEEAAARGW